MTDRINALIVILDQDIRDDDAQATINALKCIKGVLDVQPHEVNRVDEMVAELRAKTEMRKRVMAVLWDEKKE